MSSDIFWHEDPPPVRSDPVEQRKSARTRDGQYASEDDQPTAPVLPRYFTSLLGRSSHWRAGRDSD